MSNPHLESRSDRAATRAVVMPCLEAVIGLALAVAAGDLHAPTRLGSRAAFARQVAMYLAHIGFGFSFAHVGRLFDRDPTTAAYACRKMEDRRDDPGIDLMLDHLEAAARRLVASARLAA
jgi:chromosomal replication initiation ATPase DnaA